MQLVAASDSKVEFNNVVTESDSLNILLYEYMYNGGGVALADFNKDVETRHGCNSSLS